MIYSILYCIWLIMGEIGWQVQEARIALERAAEKKWEEKRVSGGKYDKRIL